MGLALPRRRNRSTFIYSSHSVQLKSMNIIYKLTLKGREKKTDMQGASESKELHSDESLGFLLAPYIPDMKWKKPATQKFQAQS